MDESVQEHLKPALSADDARILLKAADIIERDGHCKHVMYSGDDPVHGPVCLFGSILRAITGSADRGGGMFTELKNPAHGLTVALAGRVHHRMAEWNDAPERTKDEVILRMRAVALGG
jgi:hypothetical protein